MKESRATDDASMAKVREIWSSKKASKMTQEELGMLMGYDQRSARKSVSQFLKSRDPRVSMLRRFAKATGVSLSDLLRE